MGETIQRSDLAIFKFDQKLNNIESKLGETDWIDFELDNNRIEIQQH
jgi:hypothetical protein